MANRQISPVGYRPFDVQPTVAEGLLSVAREGGDLERKVAIGLARLADEMGQQADAEAKRAGMLAGAQAGLAGAPEGAKVTGGQVTGTASTNGQAGHVAGAQGGVRVETNGRLPAGMRNNNPGNIKFTGTNAFAGVIGPSVNRDQGDPQAVFATPEAGMAAMYSLAKRKYDGGKRSTNQLIAGNMGWTPGNFDAAANVARTMGIGPNDDINLSDPGMAQKFMRALMLQEHGPSSRLYTDQQITAAISGGGSSAPAAPAAAASAPRYTSLPSAASVAPISVTPVREPVKIEPGKAGTFRPTGRDTVYGRAYDVAGTRTYLEMLDMAMEQNTTAIYEAYKDDPAKLEKALGEGLTADLRDNVFEEIAPEFTVAYRKRADGLLSKARTEQRKREEERNRFDFLGRMEEYSNRQSQMLAGLDPNDPAAASDLAGLQSTIDAHWDSAAARGIVTPAEADKFKRSSRSDTVVGFYLKQLDGRSADEIAAVRTKMVGDYSAGNLPGINADDWDKIQRGAEKAQKDAKTQDDLAAKALRERGKDIAERISRGLPVAPDELTKLQLDSATATDGARIVDGSMMRVRVAEALRDQPVDTVESNLWTILTKGGFAPTPDEYDDAVKAVKARRAELKADPLGVAERAGIVPALGPLPDPATTSDDEMAAALNARMLYAGVAAERFGVQPKYFRPEEEAALKRGTTSLDTAQHASAMKQLDIVSQKLGLLEVERQFGKDATDRLQDWQAKVRYATPAEAAQWLKDRNDPQWQERVKPLVTKGETEARKLTADEVTALLDDGGRLSFSAAGPIDRDTERAMMNDFVQLTGERFAATGDAAQAKEQAVERMRKVWGTTRAFGNRGGRLMLYPPEEHYPSVAGSTGWIAEEMKGVADARGVKPEALALVSDAKTKAAIERGEAPGYLLSSVNPDTGMEELVTDDQGRPLRHFFDSKAAQEKALKAAEAARNTRNDPWLVLGRGTALGPLYPGGADPADLADRQRRIGEITDAREQRLNDKRQVRDEIRNADIPGMPVPPESQ